MGHHDHKSDDIAGRLQLLFGESSLLLSRHQFAEHVQKEATNFRPFGKFVTEFARTVVHSQTASLFAQLPTRQTPKRQMHRKEELAEQKTLRVYKVNAAQQTFRPLNKHLQALL